MKQIRTHVDRFRPLLTTTYNDAIKLDEQSAIENSPMLSVDKLSDNFSDEKLALKKNFKVVTICENLRLLFVESRDSTQLKLVCNQNQVLVSVSGTEPISSFGSGFGVEARFFVKTETLIFIELKVT